MAGVEDPLLLLQNGGGGDAAAGGGRNPRSIWMVLLSTAVAVCGSFELGACFSLFGSIVTIGAMIGAITSGRIADFTGRKVAMGMSALVCLMGWLAIGFAPTVMLLDVGRILTGYGIGILSYVVAVYIAEIAPSNLRGVLAAMSQVSVSVGVSSITIVGGFIKWRTLTLLGILPCLMLLLGVFLIPESPRWLAKVGRTMESEAALQVLRGKGTDISQEATEIQECIEAFDNLPKAHIKDLIDPKYIRAVIIGVGLMVLQQAIGTNGIVFYANKTLVDAGFSTGALATILLGFLATSGTAVGAVLVDKFGRRPLLLCSVTGAFLGSSLAGIAFFLKGMMGMHLDFVPILALLGLSVYMGAFSIGMGPIPWVIMSEIFPPNVKGIAGSLVTFVNWFGSLAISYSFNFLMSWSEAGTMLIFAGVCAASAVFVAIQVPETKGRTLEEIQASLDS